ncbi:probable cytochrome P450 49a1 isoform X2 [Panulirus ornatus]|uniref:probable cytochrome P450 49a1 isoform X2 n=1 Tax=Panulirus ornatus TaxID=150431 RepID=UPI003A87D7F7
MEVMSSGVKCGIKQTIWQSQLPSSQTFTTTFAPQLVAATSAETTIKQQKAVRSTWEIPGPRSYPLVKSLPYIVMDEFSLPGNFHLFFQKLMKNYGPIVRLENPFTPPMVAVVRPDYAEAVIRATMENPIRKAFLSLKKIREEAADNYFERKTGILAENGEEWWRVRSQVQTHMLKVKNVLTYLSSMDEITMEFMNRIALLQSQHGEMPSDFQTELYKWALESIGLVTLNRRLGCLKPDLTENSEPLKLIRLVNEVFHGLNETEFSIHLWTLFPTSSYKKLKRSHDEFLRLADRNICETEASLLAQSPDDDRDITLMEMLLLSPGLSRKDVVTLILDMLFAGIDTTSHTIGFTLYLLARNPEVQAQLQKEVDTVLGDHQGPIMQRHLAQLSYLKAVIKESMRIFPLVIGTARAVDKDIVLGGYCVPKGWSVFIVNMLMGWDESLFPRAKEFLPERWLRHKPFGPIHPYASLPFGAGTRMCVGRRIAEQEMVVFLTRVMQQFTVKYEHEDIEIKSGFVFTPSQPLRFSFMKRH